MEKGVRKTSGEYGRFRVKMVVLTWNIHFFGENG